MTAAACTPVSWLRLERYALGELDSRERAEIATHLEACGRCRACADQIAADTRELPPLPAVAAPAPRRRFAWRWPALAAVAAVAVVVVFVRRPAELPMPSGARVVAVKGGDVGVELVRERAGSVAWEPTSFAGGDRLKLLVTCPAPMRVFADVVVLQSDGVAFPGEPTVVACGNRVPVPPAFRITGAGGATVCVLLDASGPPTRAWPPGAAEPTASHACLRLDRRD
ncbi:MAG TPA: zf-HC2 domain-containing protein [Polyangia bacterium]|nr:zf-HC2 domain-containing protein [Polyangia bacterium]